MLGSSLAGQQGELIHDLMNLYHDMMQGDMGHHHGIHFMGLWNVLQAAPNLWDSIEWMFSKWLDDKNKEG